MAKDKKAAAASPFSAEQSTKIRAVLEAEPCLFNARHKRDYVTMAAWLNEVGGEQIATPENVAAIMAPAGADRWDVHAGKYVAVDETPVDDGPKVDPWAAQRKALGKALGR